MSKINFKKCNGLVPAIIQDDNTGKVLMLGFMNEEALKKTKKEKRVVFFSRTKKRLWMKGETSGNFLEVKKIITDCDNDTLLIKAIPKGNVCHTGNATCFNEENAGCFIDTLEQIIADRKKNPKSDSYTSKLFSKGIKRIAQKVGEESVEVVIESTGKNKELFKEEAADLIYHFLVLLSAKGLNFDDIIKVLEKRHGKK
ncbi:MAG: bifunctional phosphoribosyl-AMP cyclohydrolase/phosphoribosyl-ATP diphosphatase HisIE [Bacteroidales bacterium]|nr:bifunctional phosphoribosyl-AMP cyclohydrolase/phosphoribosyl-ATP diphosphatase HisIE [Bacteroidales bacterium]